MKRTALFLFIMSFLFLLMVQPADAAAAKTGDVCNYGNGIVTYSGVDQSGNTNIPYLVTIARKTEPINPVIITQDPEHTGVDILIKITSFSGTATYTRYGECTGYESYQTGMAICSPKGKDEFAFHYLPCNSPYTEYDIYRYMIGQTLQVWLQPDYDTAMWLGWKDISTDPKGIAEGKNPLGDLFPDKWDLGTWNPTNPSEVGSSGLWSPGSIQQFAEEHPGFNYLDSSLRGTELPTRNLLLVGQPNQDGASRIDRAIGLFGAFTEFLGSQERTITVGDENHCLIEGRNTKYEGDCFVSINETASTDLTSLNIWDVSINFSGIPIDLPGRWTIGVKVRFNKAIYAGDHPETPVVSPDLVLGPDQGYNPREENMFSTYMFITTFCNPNDPPGGAGCKQ